MTVDAWSSVSRSTDPYHNPHAVTTHRIKRERFCVSYVQKLEFSIEVTYYTVLL